MFGVAGDLKCLTSLENNRLAMRWAVALDAIAGHAGPEWAVLSSSMSRRKKGA